MILLKESLVYQNSLRLRLDSEFTIHLIDKILLSAMIIIFIYSPEEGKKMKYAFFLIMLMVTAPALATTINLSKQIPPTTVGGIKTDTTTTDNAYCTAMVHEKATGRSYCTAMVQEK